MTRRNPSRQGIRCVDSGQEWRGVATLRRGALCLLRLIRATFLAIAYRALVITMRSICPARPSWQMISALLRLDDCALASRIFVSASLSCRFCSDKLRHNARLAIKNYPHRTKEIRYSRLTPRLSRAERQPENTPEGEYVGFSDWLGLMFSPFTELKCVVTFGCFFKKEERSSHHD